MSDTMPDGTPSDVLRCALRRIGDIFASLGDDEVALSLFQASLAGYEWMDVHRGKADCMLRIGDIAHRRGKMKDAMALWSNSIPLFERAEQHADVEICKKRLISYGLPYWDVSNWNGFGEEAGFREYVLKIQIQHGCRWFRDGAEASQREDFDEFAVCVEGGDVYVWNGAAEDASV
ncbi:hypothetical protein BDQ17DRAFT_1327351 [Cyathus striatus]|nr:hypothetical protein BDQ17DRAFT_1327351 [Cyathus striatus]